MSYYPFQEEDLKKWWFTNKGRGILGWGIGCGKTYVANNILRSLKGTGKRALVLSPAYLLIDWIKNVSDSVDLIKYTKDSGVDYQFIACSYHMLNKLVKHKVKFDYIIADECHYVKNYNSTMGKAFRKLAHKTEYVLAMSGSISQNNDPSELYPYFLALYPDRVPKNITAYRKQYMMNAKPWMKYPTWESTTEGAKFIDNLVKKYISFRDLDEVADLPGRIEKIIRVRGTRFNLSKKVEEMAEVLGVDVNKVKKDGKLAMIHEMMMANGIDPIDKKMCNTTKIDAIRDLIKDLNGEKVIVWYHFKLFGEALHEAFPDALYVPGGSSAEHKMETVEKFKGDNQILIASQASLGTGVNMQFCRYDIHSNIWYDSVMFDQTKGRIYRTGQTKRVVSHLIVGDGTIEKDVLEVLRLKMSLRKAENYLVGVKQLRD